MRSFGEWMFDSLSAKPDRMVGTPRRGELRDERDRAASADEQRPHAQHLLERLQPELDRARIGRDEPRGCGRPQLHLDVGSGGCRLPEQPLEVGAITAGSCPTASRMETFAIASTGITVFCRVGEPPLMPCTSTEGSAQVRR